MNNRIIGWDVGGAHLKAALIDANGDLVNVMQMPCALWRGLPELESAIDLILNTFKLQPALHAITMTGELVDLFPSRQAGVQAISRTMEAKLIGSKRFYAGQSSTNMSKPTFVAFDEVERHWQTIASANWLASATYIGLQLKKLKSYKHSLLIDIGSTTSDFVLSKNLQPACLGFTDAARMQTEELVYTGVIRTPLMALAQKIKFKNSMTSVAAEYFATTADIYRLTSDLQMTDDMADTADGQDKSELASARRIARMIGHDVEDAALVDWIELAYAFKSEQLMRLSAVASMHISRMKNSHQTSEILMIGAGAGCFLVKEIASLMNIQYVDVVQLIGENLAHVAPAQFADLKAATHWATVCLPAVAVANLALNEYKAIFNEYVST